MIAAHGLFKYGGWTGGRELCLGNFSLMELSVAFVHSLGRSPWRGPVPCVGNDGMRLTFPSGP